MRADAPADFASLESEGSGGSGCQRGKARGNQAYGQRTSPILAAANAVIDLASERFTKNLWSDRASAERPYLVNVADNTAQAGYIVEQILENREAGITLLCIGDR
jgi:hypothetical protein